MKNEDIDKNGTLGKKQGNLESNTSKKNGKDCFTSKKDVDEYDISQEYFTKGKLESDGEDL